jgi:hypothetical protein
MVYLTEAAISYLHFSSVVFICITIKPPGTVYLQFAFFLQRRASYFFANLFSLYIFLISIFTEAVAAVVSNVATPLLNNIFSKPTSYSLALAYVLS